MMEKGAWLESAEAILKPRQLRKGCGFESFLKPRLGREASSAGRPLRGLDDCHGHMTWLQMNRAPKKIAAVSQSVSKRVS